MQGRWGRGAGTCKRFIKHCAPNLVRCQCDGGQDAMENLPPWAVTIAAVAVGLSPGLALLSVRPIIRLFCRASWPRPEVVPGSEGELPHGEPAALPSPARMRRRTGCPPLAAQLTRSVSAAGNHLSSLPKWAIWWIALAAVLSPVLAFLGAIGVEVLIGTLVDTGPPTLSLVRRRWRHRLVSVPPPVGTPVRQSPSGDLNPTRRNPLGAPGRRATTTRALLPHSGS